MKGKIWPTVTAMALTAAVTAGACAFFLPSRPILPDGARAQVARVEELHGTESESLIEAVDEEALADCLALLRCKKYPFSRKVEALPNDCYEVTFTTGGLELYTVVLDWDGEGYFYDVSTTSSYALDGQGDALRQSIDRMLGR